MRALRFGMTRQLRSPTFEPAALRFAEAVTAVLKRPVRVSFVPDYEQLREGLAAGAVDFAWMPPLVHLRAAECGELLAVSQRAGRLTYRAAILVAKENRIRSVAGLKKSRLAWSDLGSASGYLFPRMHLLARAPSFAKRIESEEFFGSAKLACAAVARGAADLSACYVTEGATADLDRAQVDVERALGVAIAGKLRVLELTDSIPPDGIMAARNLDSEWQARLRDTLLTLHEHAAGAESLDELMQAERLSPVTLEVQQILNRCMALTDAL